MSPEGNLKLHWISPDEHWPKYLNSLNYSQVFAESYGLINRTLLLCNEGERLWLWMPWKDISPVTSQSFSSALYGQEICGSKFPNSPKELSRQNSWNFRKISCLKLLGRESNSYWQTFFLFWVFWFLLWSFWVCCCCWFCWGWGFLGGFLWVLFLVFLLFFLNE